jgi:adenylate kinase family enzyme
MPIKLFISYAHQDRALVDKFSSHLSTLERQNLITVWYDHAISVGTDWKREIDQQLQDADIILFFISADFLASDYVYSEEMRIALQRHISGEARVIPIILRPCLWEDAPFGKLQALPTDGKPVTQWKNRDEAFFNVAEGIRSVINDLLDRGTSSTSEANRKDTTSETPFRPLVSYRLPDVFVKSGLPDVTFVPREDFFLLKLALEQPGRGVVIEGPSGVGKTTSVEKAVESLKNTELRAHIPIQRLLSARNPEDRKALQTLRRWHKGTVIIDDFHRLDVNLRQDLVDYLKELADTSSKTKKIVIVGIPRTSQSLVNLSSDVATRLDVFTLGRVKDELILQMIEKGEAALNISFDRKSELALVANGSLNVAQFICFYLCALSGIEQTQNQKQVLHCDIDRAIEYVMTYLAKKFEESIEYFIAMGGARDVTGLRLLEELALTEDGFLSLPFLKDSRPDLALNIKRFSEEHWMEKLYNEHPDISHHLFFDQVRQTLVIDDPQLAFYLKKVRFSTLAKEVGKASTLAQRKVFISYSHNDTQWLERLRIHLKPVEREGIIDLWDDTKIAAGAQWKEAIMDALDTARVAILLVSADFLASDFIAEHELPTLLSRAKEAGTTIIPVILSPSLFSDTSLGTFQSINAPNHPITDMTFSMQEQIFVKIAQTIMERFRAE